MSQSTRQRTTALCLAVLLLPATCIRTTPLPRDWSQRVAVSALPAPALARRGAFALAGAWHLSSPDWRFGGYSALAIPAPGRMLALSDQGYLLDFAQPGGDGPPPRIGPVFAGKRPRKQTRDVEAITRDPATGRLWLALEGRNVIAALGPDLVPKRLRQPAAMQGWPGNSGAEAMVRLADGRFLVLAEAFTGLADWSGHPALRFSGDPTLPGARAEHFVLEGPGGYRPTDIAQLPDGRVLVLMRRLVWPFPARFANKLALADPAEIVAGGRWRARELAQLDAPWPSDNLEALALENGKDGRMIAWIMSDSNNAVTQRTLLLRLEFRMADLPPKQKARR